MAFVSSIGRNKIIDNNGEIADIYNFMATDDGYALRVNEALIPNAEDNVNNVLHVSHRPLANANTASHYATTTLTSSISGVIKSTPGKLYKISGFIVPATSDGYTLYLQLYNATSVPADTAVPRFCLPYTLGSNTIPRSFEYEFCSFGSYFDTGICWGISTTAATKTIITTQANAWIQASYI